VYSAAHVVHMREAMTPAAIACRVLVSTAAFALLHSALASRTAKSLAARAFGERRRNGLYRAFFNTQALAATAVLAMYLRQLPDRELYRVRGPAAALMRAGQGAGLLLFVDATHRVGLLPITGLSSVMGLTRATNRVPAEPEAQGPALGEDGRLKLGGAFLRSRHPLNLAPLPILWLNPRMTRNLAVFSAIATVYFWIGSVHEERRLLAAYGETYRRYVSGPTPFFLGARTLRIRQVDAAPP
jgi:methanethiol S-methyltransferase